MTRHLWMKKGFSQEGIADATCMARTYIGRIERGGKNRLIPCLIQLAFTLNVEVGFLYHYFQSLRTQIMKRTEVIISSKLRELCSIISQTHSFDSQFY